MLKIILRILMQYVHKTHPPILSLATCSGSVEKYGDPLDACNSFCRVQSTPGPINAGDMALTRIPCGAKSLAVLTVMASIAALLEA